MVKIRDFHALASLFPVSSSIFLTDGRICGRCARYVLNVHIQSMNFWALAREECAHDFPDCHQVETRVLRSPDMLRSVPKRR